MPRFISIPVAQGDAFYFEREELSVLIDGGKSRIALPAMFQMTTKTNGVDVLICTHNDADHANGILGFLEAGLRCEEVWLPGRWLGLLPDLLKPFVEVFVELANDIADLDNLQLKEAANQKPYHIERLSEDLLQTVSDAPDAQEGILVQDNGWPEPYMQILENAEPWEHLMPWHQPWNFKDLVFWGYHHYRRMSSAEVNLLWSAIDAANRIRKIALEAFHRGIPVRWFEFDVVKPSGGITVLKPINSKEIARIRPRVGTLMFYLTLTVSNKESLVFWSPSADNHPGVLFTADSDLAGAKLPVGLDRAIVTSPHHGSEANANAYKAVANCNPKGFGSTTWVRSDGNYRSRPGPSYLGLASRKLCTICRHAGGHSSTKQTVKLYSRKGFWIRHKASLTCSCK